MATALIMAMVLGSPFLGTSGAAAESRQDVIPYELSLPMHDSSLRQLGLDLDLGLAEPECDTQGLFAVRFCEAFSDGTPWNRVTIQVWDHGNPTPVPIGAKYTFRTGEGETLQEGVFCEMTNTRVPEGAEDLLVEVAHIDTLTSDSSCGVAPFSGDVWLSWSSVQESQAPTPEESEDNANKCICECDCHPIFGCECECRPADGSDCECNVEE